MSVIMSDCLDCKHYQGKNRCLAFPIEIPKELFWNKSKSSRSEICNDNIKFEPIDE